MSNKAQEEFEGWADEKGFCLDQIWMSTAGVPENPYEDEDTKLAYEIWRASRSTAKGHHAAEVITSLTEVMIGAYENGFVDSNTLTVADMYQTARNHIRDHYGVEMPNIVEQFGEESAELAGLNEIQLKNLNNITAGTKLKFKGQEPGVVDHVMRSVKDQNGDVCKARLCVRYEDGSESYHTFRHDGRSQHDASHDIVSVEKGDI